MKENMSASKSLIQAERRGEQKAFIGNLVRETLEPNWVPTWDEYSALSWASSETIFEEVPDNV